MEQYELQSLRHLLSLVAIVVTTSAVASFCSAIYIYIATRAIREFLQELQEQVRSYMATHQLWSDVGYKIVSSGPELLEGGIRLANSLQQLSQMVDRAGGIGKVIEKAAGPRKPRTIKTTPSATYTTVQQEA